MSDLFRAAAGALVGIVLATGAARAEDYTVGYSQFWGTNPFLVTMANGAKKAVGEWADKGVKVDMILTNGGDTDTTKQVADLEDLYAQGVQGLILFPGDSIVLAEPVKNIFNKENIPVVVTDIGLQSGSWDTFIITDNYAGGESAAELMAKTVPAGAKVITFDHAPGNDNAQMRQKGFEDKAKELGLERAAREVPQAEPGGRPQADGGHAGRDPRHQGRVLLQSGGGAGRCGSARRPPTAPTCSWSPSTSIPSPTRWSRTARSWAWSSRTRSRWATRA